MSIDRKFYKGLITHLDKNQILVFGSNPEGRHGKGVARLAYDKFGAVIGKGSGLSGQSYGLVTKNLRKGFYDKELGLCYKKAGPRSVSKKQIIANIGKLYGVAIEMKDKEFYIAYTAKGKLLNGYTSKEMAGMFYMAGEMFTKGEIPSNIIFEDEFWKLIEKFGE